MKKFISVILAALMLVTVMPFAIFAADEYKEPANKAHGCHPVDADGKPVTVDVDMKALYEAEKIAITFEGAKDYNKPAYLVDGKNDTATRLTKGDKTVITITATEAVDFATLKLVVNGKGTINGGSSYADKVTVDTKHDLKLNVVVYALKDGKDVAVFTSDKDINTKDLTEVVLDVYEPGYKVVITTVGTAEEGKGGPRLWEIDATTVQGADAYVHTWANTITKYPSLGVEGEYTQKCSVCGYDNPEKQVIPALTKDTLTGGILGVDAVKSFKEITTRYETVDGKQVVAKDDDGNEVQIDKITGSNTAALFNGILGTGGGWYNGGDFYAGNTGAQLEIVFNNVIEPTSFDLYIWMNWAQLTFDFYKGEEKVATMPKVTLQAQNSWVDLSTYTYNDGTKDVTVDVSKLAFDKIVITYDYSKGNCTKLGEMKIGTHKHIYDDSLIEALEPTRTEGKTCEFTFADASKVVCRECGVAAGAENAKVTLTIHDYPETVVDGKVVFDQSKGKVTAATCGKDGKVEYTCSHKFNDTTKPIYARYFKKVDGKDVPVYGNNNQQLYLGKDGKGYDGTKITDWSTIVVSGYSDTACGDKLVEVIPATGAHKSTTTTVRIGKYPNCGANGSAYVICTDCKQRVEIATAADLVKYGFATDAEALYGTNLDKSMTDEATGKAYTVRFAVDAEGKVTSIVSLANGYHTTSYKNVVASTYTKPGIDCAYCTTCGATFKEITKEAALAVPNAKVRFIEFSLRTTEFEGVRGTFSLNNEVIKAMQAAGYNVRIFMVVTNEAGVSKELQVYGAGAKATVALDGRFNVVVKGAAADDTLTFSYKVIVDDQYGTAENVVELASASIEDVKAAK